MYKTNLCYMLGRYRTNHRRKTNDYIYVRIQHEKKIKGSHKISKVHAIESDLLKCICASSCSINQPMNFPGDDYIHTISISKSLVIVTCMLLIHILAKMLPNQCKLYRIFHFAKETELVSLSETVHQITKSIMMMINVVNELTHHEKAKLDKATSFWCQQLENETSTTIIKTQEAAEMDCGDRSFL